MTNLSSMVMVTGDSKTKIKLAFSPLSNLFLSVDIARPKTSEVPKWNLSLWLFFMIQFVDSTIIIFTMICLVGFMILGKLTTQPRFSKFVLIFDKFIAARSPR